MGAIMGDAIRRSGAGSRPFQKPLKTTQFDAIQKTGLKMFFESGGQKIKHHYSVFLDGSFSNFG